MFGRYFPVFDRILLYLSQNEKRIISMKYRGKGTLVAWYYMAIKTKNQVGQAWKK